MAWEQRGLQKVYYRSRRVNGHVTKIYYGSGQRAQQAYEQDLRQQEAKERERAMRKEIEALDLQTDSLTQTIRTIAHAHLLLAGYHQHNRGGWRKQRQQTITQHEGDIMLPQIQGQENLSIEELEISLQRAMAGDKNSLPAIRLLLDKAPAFWQTAFGLVQRVEKAWIQTIAGQDLLTRETLIRQVDDLKRTLQADFSSPLESLIVETIVSCFLAYKQAELSSAQQLQRNNGMGLTQAQQNHITACQKRYLLAVKELARVRQLLTPRTTTTVVNIADKQQVNLG